jgi:hypothetical protein
MKKQPTLYEKLTSQKHIDLNGKVSYKTFPGDGGSIMAQHYEQTPQKILIFDNPNGRMTIWNMTKKIQDDTFILRDNCCAEQFHKRIEIISK